jgi:hypothetical protein
MKKIIIVDVPDGFEFHKRIEACNMQPGFARRFELLELTEITLPTDEEIVIESKICTEPTGFEHGAKWLKSKILEK